MHTDIFGGSGMMVRGWDRKHVAFQEAKYFSLTSSLREYRTYVSKSPEHLDKCRWQNIVSTVDRHPQRVMKWYGHYTVGEEADIFSTRQVRCKDRQPSCSSNVVNSSECSSTFFLSWYHNLFSSQMQIIIFVKGYCLWNMLLKSSSVSQITKSWATICNHLKSCT